MAQYDRADFAKDAVFVNLLQAVAKHKFIYYTEDGLMYPQETSALGRRRDAARIHIHLRYAVVTENNMPLNESDLDKLFIENDNRLRELEIQEKKDAQRKYEATQPAISFEDAAARLAELRKAKAKPEEPAQKPAEPPKSPAKSAKATK